MKKFIISLAAFSFSAIALAADSVPTDKSSAKSTGHQVVDKTAAQLKTKGKEIVDKGVEAASKVADNISDATKKTGTTVGDVAKDAAEKSEGFFASISNKISSSSTSTQEWISANPKAAVAIAAGVAVIATAVVIAKCKTVQSFLGFETEEDSEFFS